MNAMDSNVTNKLASDLKSMIHDAQELLKATGQQVDDGYRSARSKLESTLQSASSGLSSLEDSAIASARDTAKSADRYVKDHPWQAVGAGALAGLICGLVIGRK